MLVVEWPSSMHKFGRSGPFTSVNNWSKVVHDTPAQRRDIDPGRLHEALLSMVDGLEAPQRCALTVFDI